MLLSISPFQTSACITAAVPISMTGNRVLSAYSQLQVPQISAIAASSSNIDLTNKHANIANITFVPLEKCSANIVLFKCARPVSTCMQLKNWLYQSVSTSLRECPEILRIDPLMLENLDPRAEAHIVLVQDAAFVSFHNPRLQTPLVVMALLVHRDPSVRWFYTPFDMSAGLKQLQTSQIIKIRKVLTPSSRSHKRLFTFLRQQFQKDIPLPHHPDFLKVTSMTDYSPTVEMSEVDAMGKLESDKFLHFHPAEKDGKGLEKDRYLLELHGAERWLASEVGLHCAKYLLTKRLFFKDFGIECIRNKEKLRSSESHSTTPRINHRARTGMLRTDAAHQRWLENSFEWRPKRARKLVVGWRILGLLDESKFLSWARAGGMFESIWGDDKEEEVQSTALHDQHVDEHETLVQARRESSGSVANLPDGVMTRSMRSKRGST